MAIAAPSAAAGRSGGGRAPVRATRYMSPLVAMRYDPGRKAVSERRRGTPVEVPGLVLPPPAGPGCPGGVVRQGQPGHQAVTRGTDGCGPTLPAGGSPRAGAGPERNGCGLGPGAPGG